MDGQHHSSFQPNVCISLPVDVPDGLLLDLLDLLVQGVLSHRLKRASHPRRTPLLLSVPHEEKVEKIQQIDAAIAVRVEPARGQAPSTNQVSQREVQTDSSISDVFSGDRLCIRRSQMPTS